MDFWDFWVKWLDKHLITLVALGQALAIAYITYHFQRLQEKLKKEHAVDLEKRKQENAKELEKMKQDHSNNLEKAKNSYQIELEQVKMELKRREQASNVAKLLSDWISIPEGHMTDEEKKELTKLIWEATLYLDDETARELNGLITKKRKLSVFEVLILIKGYLQGKKSELEPEEISWFPIK